MPKKIQASYWNDPKSDRLFLVHAFNPYAKMSVGGILGCIAARDSLNEKPLLGDQSIDLMQKPLDVAERQTLSMSLISHEKPTTWGNGGLLIAAPRKNIVATSRSDIGAINTRKQIDTYRRQPQLSPEELHDISSKEMYNEVLAVGTDEETGSQLKTIGFFIKIGSNGQALDEDLALRLQALSHQYHLPLISIQHYNRHKTNQVYKEDKGTIALSYKGEYHYFYQCGEAAGMSFHALRENGTSYFIGLNKFNELLQYLVDHHQITNEVIDRLREAYKDCETRFKTQDKSEKNDLKHLLVFFSPTHDKLRQNNKFKDDEDDDLSGGLFSTAFSPGVGIPVV